MKLTEKKVLIKELEKGKEQEALEYFKKNYPGRTYEIEN